MQTRLKSLQRVATVYVAMKHAQALSLEQAAGALRETEVAIERQKAREKRSSLAGRAALDAGDCLDWQMHESEKQVTRLNAAGLHELREHRDVLMVEAAETYRAGWLRLEQMESVLRHLRSKIESEMAHRAQRESDDRFLSRQWWEARGRTAPGCEDDDSEGRMKAD